MHGTILLKCLEGGDLLGPDKHVLLELNTKADRSLALSVKYQNEMMPAPPLENAATLQQLVNRTRPCC
ncbi:hypothetical protein PsorP6_010310 [Peronosclerospora sorghi]|uniref:Uncharacterized protein n=1 Tax=Peronosclerospora sorghi TaxID=230839 RepID=A0ACC0VVW1_9STRA|nr:hypothetical protein PsorP6_010310 [Peronosclerospora sorghi]